MLLIAHRGDTVNFPENTIAAFRSALEKGADGIEMDVQVINGEPVIVHDYIRPPGGEFPKLSDVLTEFGGRGYVEIEIKSFRTHDVERIVDTIRHASVPNLELTSSVLPILPHIRKILPDAVIGAIFPQKFIEDWMTEDFMADLFDGYMQLTRANIIHLPPSVDNTAIVSKLKQSYRIHHHLKTADPTQHDRFADLGVDRVTFDDIRLVANVRMR